MHTDLDLYIDPVCPFAWLTSSWVRTVQRQRGDAVRWRFLSLRMLNAARDYDRDFAPGYEGYHQAGLRLLRVAARIRAEHGEDSVGPYLEAVGEQLFDRPRTREAALSHARDRAGSFAEQALSRLGLPRDLVDALDDPGLDATIRAQTDAAVALVGPALGTPVLQVRPPDGPALFGPVISAVPMDADAVSTWDHVVALASMPGFVELKRSLREMPRMPPVAGAPAPPSSDERGSSPGR